MNEDPDSAFFSCECGGQSWALHGLGVLVLAGISRQPLSHGCGRSYVAEITEEENDAGLLLSRTTTFRERKTGRIVSGQTRRFRLVSEFQREQMERE